jgi:hypothetical protein
MAEPDKQAELTAIFKELLRALRLVRELSKLLESIARRLTEFENGKDNNP